MSLYIVAVILFSGVLTDFVGTVLPTDARRLPKKHQQPYHRRWRDYELEESVGLNRPWKSLDPLSPNERETRRDYIDDRGKLSRPWRHDFKVRGNAGAFATRTKRHHKDVSKHESGGKYGRAIIYGDSKPFNFETTHELEESQAQNASICNYTVEPIADQNGNWILKHLRHVKCNHVGSKCHKEWPHRCKQTYREITVRCNDDDCSTSERIKVYTGCVCALNVESKLDDILGELND